MPEYPKVDDVTIKRNSIPNEIYFVLQSLGSGAYTHNASFDHAMLSNPVNSNLDNNNFNQSLLDYKESTNITSVTKTEVISDYEFIALEDRLTNTILNGTAEIGLQLAIRGDGTYITTLDEVRLNLFKRTSGGVDTAIITDKLYTFDTGPTYTANENDDKIGVKTYSDIAETTLNEADRLVLRVEVFAHVNNASATNNKARLYFSRGSYESYMIVRLQKP